MMLAEAMGDALPGISPAVYREADFRAVGELVYGEAGIVVPQGKSMLVYSRLAPLVRESGCGTFANYIALARQDSAVLARIVAALTTNHTFFYREAHHFEHFESEVRPGLLRRLENGGGARFWSAGCSSGEETWSLVMTLLGADRSVGRSIAKQNIRVLASDIAPKALAKAAAATYPAKDLAPVPGDLVQNWVSITDDTAKIADEARALVRLRTLNLQGSWPMKGTFDVIFCRNVMIYFDTPTKERLVARFADMLAPGGHLYIGHSERVTGPALNQLSLVGPTIYSRRAT